nr:MAG TPA: hypothetical protein [Caudoviricetes sp.]
MVRCFGTRCCCSGWVVGKFSIYCQWVNFRL